MWIRRLTGLALILFLGVAALAADSGETPPPIARSRSRIVHVTVIATDRKGNPIVDLHSDDFRLRDNGVPQEVQIFLSPARQGRVGASTDGENLASSQGTTLIPENASTPCETILLLDTFNIDPENRQYAVLQVQEFLKKRKPGEKISLYILGQKLIQVDNLTERKALIAAMSPFTGWASSMEKDVYSEYDTIMGLGLGESGLDKYKKESLKAVKRSFMSENELFTVQKTHKTLYSLADLAQNLAGKEGRKNLVWLSNGIPFFTSDGGMLRSITNESCWKTALESMQKSNVSLYPVDARGATGVMSNDPNWMAMEKLAAETGGKYYHSSNDFQGMISQIHKQASATYTLAFRPSHDQWDGSFHFMTVSMDRPGVQLQYRRTYQAIRDSEVTEDEWIIPMVSIGCSPLEATGLSVKAALESLGADPGARQDRYRVNMNLSRLEFDPRKTQSIANLDLVILSFDRSGKALSAVKQGMEIERVSARTHSEDSCVSASLDCSVPVKASRIKVILRERSTGRLGSVSFDVAQLSRNAQKGKGSA